jgi:hypothetical protein
VHLVGFIIRKFVTMHGHMNVNKNSVYNIYEALLHITDGQKYLNISFSNLSLKETK